MSTNGIPVQIERREGDVYDHLVLTVPARVAGRGRALTLALEHADGRPMGRNDAQDIARWLNAALTQDAR